MKCGVCRGEMVCVYRSDYGLSVSSENKILEHNIELYECAHCHHIQKSPSSEVLELIYQGYQSDCILPNMEQVKFEQGESKSCSQAVLDHTRAFIPDTPKLAMLDYGAGGGGMLKSFLTTYPQARVYAYDVNANNRETFEKMERFGGFYENLDEIRGSFDCITLIHVLEHISDLEQTLARLYELLDEKGVLLIQVPDVAQNIWDVFVYDHIHHFTYESLRRVCEKSGFVVSFPKQQIQRQITLVAQKSQQCAQVENLDDQGERGFQRFELQRLLDALCLVEETIQAGQKICVFGTTPPSTFLARMLGDCLEGFLDEDQRKIGKTHLGKPIFAPYSYDLYSGCVLMPLGQNLSQTMRQKYDFKQVIEAF